MIPRFQLPQGHEISRLIKGGWHLSGDHGAIDPEQAVHDMAAFVEAGIDTFDCADIYTNAETLIGAFRRRHPVLAGRLRVHTKFVPNLSDLAVLKPADVARTVERSLQRLGLERLDLVQFHWWDFDVPGHVEAALALTRLREQGKIANLAVTNYDTAHLRELLDAGVPVIAHQLQYSLLDERPRGPMLALARERAIPFLCYGTVAGGFLSDRWLDQPPPQRLSNRSLIKYQLIIEDFGGWPRLQQLLQALRGVADKHGCDIATVATRAVLDRDNVAAAIVGAINTSHLPAHRQVGALQLDADDRAALAAAVAAGRPIEGDVYALERDRHGRHGRIMKYELQ
jgi:aryl-alcohol dehydrogenase-like predicted oxidoreductase